MKAATDPSIALALRKTLDWIDGVPAETSLPAMPGFDRDWVESMIAGQTEGWPALTLDDALQMAIDWVEAVPDHVRATLPPLPMLHAEAPDAVSLDSSVKPIMRQADVEKWIGELKAGDEVGVFSGSRLLFKSKVAKRTPSGRVVCEPDGTFKASGDILDLLADHDRRIRPISI